MFNENGTRTAIERAHDDPRRVRRLVLRRPSRPRIRRRCAGLSRSVLVGAEQGAVHTELAVGALAPGGWLKPPLPLVRGVALRPRRRAPARASTGTRIGSCRATTRSCRSGPGMRSRTPGPIRRAGSRSTRRCASRPMPAAATRSSPPSPSTSPPSRRAPRVRRSAIRAFGWSGTTTARPRRPRPWR